MQQVVSQILVSQPTEPQRIAHRTCDKDARRATCEANSITLCFDPKPALVGSNHWTDDLARHYVSCESGLAKVPPSCVTYAGAIDIAGKL